MLTVEYARNPVYATEAGDCISLIVKFYEMAEELPFGATPYDDMTYGVELYYNAQAGMYGPVGPYVPPPKPTADEQPTTTGAQTL